MGSAFVLLQFALTLFGFGGDSGDGGDASFDLDGDGVPDVATVDLDGDGVPDAAAPNDGLNESVHRDAGGTHFLRVFSVRTLTAGIAFFGLSGLAMRESGAALPAQLAVACVCGFVAIIAVFFLFRMLSSFNADGSIRASSALGAEGSVYLTVPASRAKQGKVTILQQERSMEYEALTDSEVDLKPGTPVVVEKILGDSTLLVRPK